MLSNISWPASDIRHSIVALGSPLWSYLARWPALEIGHSRVAQGSPPWSYLPKKVIRDGTVSMILWKLFMLFLALNINSLLVYEGAKAKRLNLGPFWGLPYWDLRAKSRIKNKSQHSKYRTYNMYKVKWFLEPHPLWMPILRKYTTL